MFVSSVLFNGRLILPMNFAFPQHELMPVALLLLFILLTATVIFLIMKERKRDAKFERFSESVYDFALKRAEKRAHDIVWRATNQARDIFVNAELQGVKAVARVNVDRKHIEAKYEEALAGMSDMIRQQLAKDSTVAEQGLEKMAAAFGAALEGHLAASMGRLNETLEQHAKLVEKTLADFAAENTKRISETIVGELQKAQTSLKVYEDARMEAIDMRTADLISRTTEIVLSEALPPETHVRLIHRALEEARKEGFFK